LFRNYATGQLRQSAIQIALLLMDANSHLFSRSKSEDNSLYLVIYFELL